MGEVSRLSRERDQRFSWFNYSLRRLVPAPVRGSVSGFLLSFFLFLFVFPDKLPATGSAACTAAPSHKWCSVVTDSGPKHTAITAGCRQETPLATCQPTREPFLHNLSVTGGGGVGSGGVNIAVSVGLMSPQREQTLKSISQSSTAC